MVDHHEEMKRLKEGFEKVGVAFENLKEVLTETANKTKDIIERSRDE